MATVVTRNNIAWTFDEDDITTGTFATGDPWIVPATTATLSAVSPGHSTSGGRTLGGTMLNPSPLAQDAAMQGLDSNMGGGILPIADIYDVSLNIGAALPSVISTGTSIVSCQSQSTIDQRPTLTEAQVLTVLSSAPAADAFRPPYCGTDKTIKHLTATVDARQNLLPSLVIDPDILGVPTLTTVEALFQYPWFDWLGGWVGDYLHPVNNCANYGADQCADISDAALLLVSDAGTYTEKKTLLYRFIQLGIDLWGCAKTGQGADLWEGAGGDGQGRKWPIMFASVMLDSQEMAEEFEDGYTGVDEYKQVKFAEDRQTFFVDETSPDTYNWGHLDSYLDTDVGVPEFGAFHLAVPGFPGKWDRRNWTDTGLVQQAGEPSGISGTSSVHYRRSSTANRWYGMLLAAMSMNQVGSWNHEALFEYMFRYEETEKLETGGMDTSTYAWRPWQAEMWRTYATDLYAGQKPKSGPRPEKTY